jgi:FkbM family methyltransferase
VYSVTPSKAAKRAYYRSFCFLVRNLVLERSVDGIRFRLYLKESIDLALFLNKYEPDVTRAIERLCSPGMTVLDIGANVGAHTLRIARIVGESGRVFGFEPTNYAYKKLVDNIGLNQFRNITALRLALSNEGYCRRRMRFTSSWLTSGKSVAEESVVECEKLDDWCAREQIEGIDLIKLDVDGNEHSVIMGGRYVLKRDRPEILMEVWGPNFADTGVNPCQALQELGYGFFHIDTGLPYGSIDEMRKRVSSPGGELLDFSINVIARCTRERV